MKREFGVSVQRARNSVEGNGFNKPSPRFNIFPDGPHNNLIPVRKGLVNGVIKRFEERMAMTGNLLNRKRTDGGSSRLFCGKASAIHYSGRENLQLIRTNFVQYSLTILAHVLGQAV